MVPKKSNASKAPRPPHPFPDLRNRELVYVQYTGPDFKLPNGKNMIFENDHLVFDTQQIGENNKIILCENKGALVVARLEINSHGRIIHPLNGEALKVNDDIKIIGVAVGYFREH